MSAYVFLGPTLRVEEAQSHFDATYLPPIEQGDLLRLLARKPQTVAIIDGRFQFVPSVWHKEILAALSEGVHVFGGASMGALRAAELEPFGMVGAGEVFELYRSGAIEDDDEVAVAHAGAEHQYRETSDAMVNIRDVCRQAVDEGSVSRDHAGVIQEIAKKLYFPERSWSRVFELVREYGLPAGTIEAVDRVRRTRIPVKRRDAIALLRQLHRRESEPQPRFTPKFHLEETVFLQQLRAETSHPPAVWEPTKVARKKVLLEVLALQEARRSGTLTDQSISEMTTWYREQSGWTDDSAFDAFRQRTGISADTFRNVMERFTAVAAAQEAYKDEIESALPGHLKVMGARSGMTWSQWNVALSRENGTAADNALKLFAELRPILRELQRRGKLQQFYFMRKAPDIRLRFRGEVVAIDAAIQDLLEKARESSWITSFHQSVYEPETQLFGGAAAMDLVHAYFDSDSWAWLESTCWDRAYSVAVLHELFLAVLGNQDEALQTWAEMQNVDNAAPISYKLPSQLPVTSKEHGQANQQLAEGLQELWAAGALSRGLRAILASVAMFHFNRYGIPGSIQAALAKAMAEKLSAPSYSGAVDCV